MSCGGHHHRATFNFAHKTKNIIGKETRQSERDVNVGHVMRWSVLVNKWWCWWCWKRPRVQVPVPRTKSTDLYKDGLNPACSQTMGAVGAWRLVDDEFMARSQRTHKGRDGLENEQTNRQASKEASKQINDVNC